MAKQRQKKLGEILVQSGAVTEAAVDEALKHAQKENLRIGEALVSLGLTDEEEVAKALAVQHNMPYVDLAGEDPTACEKGVLPDEVIRARMVAPLTRENGKLRVAIADPLDLETLDMLKFRISTPVQPCIASTSKLRNFLNLARPQDSDVSIDAAIDELRRATIDLAPDETSGLDLLNEDVNAPIVRLVHMLITQAVEMRASDIHIEPMENRVRVRYRIDGVCVERDNIHKRMQGSVINRLKIMAGIDLAEKRVPTDGRITMNVGGSPVDFRVSCLPAQHGESVVLRILRPESIQLGIPALGFEQDHYEQFMQIIKRPNGMFLVTGPTGSGKSTTLYAAINEINRPDWKIITAEDPVEYAVSGVNQVQVNEAIGLTFANILREMLRQAPNVILVGEIRDLEVAEVATQAAMTGHLVFSTLHTNDAPSAITRLIDMGVQPFMVASSVQAVMAQRLIRVICDRCKAPDPDVDPKILKYLGFRDEEMSHTTFYRGRGCDACHGSGFRGRLAIFEMMQMTPQVRELAYNRAPLSEIRQAARASGMRSLLEDGKIKVAKGITTAEEVLRVAQAEELIVEE